LRVGVTSVCAERPSRGRNSSTARATAGHVVGLDVQGPGRGRTVVAREPIGERSERGDHEHVHGSETEALVQATGVAVSDQHLEARVLQARGASRLEDPCEQRLSDALVARVRLHVDVRDVRGLPPAVAEDAEHEPDRVPLLFGDEGDAVAHGLCEVGPGLLPALPQVGGPGELGLERRPQLANELLVVLRGAADGHG